MNRPHGDSSSVAREHLHNSATVGNGWSDTTGNLGNLAIRNNELTCPSESGGTFRPFPFTAPITTTARVKEESGFGTLLRRYVTHFLVRNNGTFNQGYGVVVGRSDENFDNSTVILVEDNVQLASIPSTFQYGPEIHVSVTFNLDGSITGTVSEPAPSTNTFSFSFGPHAIQSTGGNFSIAVECSSGPVDQRIDDMSITDNTNNKGFLEFPLSVPGYNCNLRRNCDGVVLAYSGEEGRQEFGENCPPPGYKNENGTDFLTGVVNYVGTMCGSRRSEAFRFPRRFLDYDGHSGYDYRYGGAPILAAADGMLEIPVSDPINNPRGSSPHKTFNTLRIIHPNGYETWYLHAQAGSECVAFGTCPNRPASGDTIPVVRGQQIGISGDTGARGRPHLHFEVRQALDQVVDPYV